MNPALTSDEIIDPDAIVYQKAQQVWQTFSRGLEPFLKNNLFENPVASHSEVFVKMMHLLPYPERVPVLLGALITGSGRTDPKIALNLCGAIAPDMHVREWDAFKSVIKSGTTASAKLTTTVEEFPSRIWQRALASGSMKRIAAAAILARDAITPLLDECVELAEPEDPMEFLVASGDLPAAFDLLGLAPVGLAEMKTQVIKHFENEVIAGRFEMSEGQQTMLSAWALADTQKGNELIQLMGDQARSLIESLERKPNLHSRHHLRRLGRMFFRLGHRAEARRCAKAIGQSVFAQGWHHQPIAAKTHSHIRNQLLGPCYNADSWQRDPALACSAMSIPLWLSDGVNRLPALMGIFTRADKCPWVFPRLQHIYQWHLALAGNQKALNEIESFSPELSLGLTGNQ